MGNMKDSGVEWIGQIPEEWNVTRVKYLAQDIDSVFIDGDWIESDIIVESGVRYLTTGNVGSGYFKEQGSGYITEETFKKLNCLKVLPGDLMISRLNEPIGRACIVPDTEEKYVVAVDNVILRPDKGYNKKYIMYCMNTDGYANAGKEAARGATMQRVSRTLLGGFYIPVAKEAEQQLIADFLDDKVGKIDDILSDLRKQVETLQKYKKSVITKAVTKGLDSSVTMKDSGIKWIGEIPESWEYKRLKYLLKQNCVNLRVGPFGSSLSGSDIKDEGYWVYNQRCVLDKNFEYNDTYVDEEKFRELYGFRVFPNDVLITTRGTIGKVVIVPQNAPEGILHPCIIKFVLDEKLINNKLIEYIFNESEIITEQIFRQSNSTTIEVIYSYTLKDLVLPVIPEKEQQQIIDYLDDKCAKIDELIKDKEAQIEKMEKYKKSLIFEYVTGKKRVKGAV